MADEKNYRIDTDLEAGEFPGRVATPDTGYVTYVNYLTGDEGADRFSPGAVDSMGYVQSIPVSPEEADRWMLAHAEFKREMDQAHEQLAEAAARWKHSVESWNGRVAAATAAYTPVHEEIKHRQERVELERQVEEGRQAEQEEALRTLLAEAEDHVLGSREYLFVTAEKNRIEPIIHHVSCRIVKQALARKTSALTRKKFGLIPRRKDEVLSMRQPETRICSICMSAHLAEEKGDTK